MFCPKCGSKNEDEAKFCASCGATMGKAPAPEKSGGALDAASQRLQASVETHDNAAGSHVTTVNVQVPNMQKNGIGTAGFVIALLGLFLCWIPVLGWILWILGALLSVIGLFKKPKGLAVAGTIISFIDVILLVVVIAGCTAGVGAIGAASLL